MSLVNKAKRDLFKYEDIEITKLMSQGLFGARIRHRMTLPAMTCIRDAVFEAYRMYDPSKLEETYLVPRA